MIKRFKQWRFERRLSKRPPLEQVLILVAAKIDNPEVLEKLEPEQLAEQVFLAVERLFKRRIEAGLEMTSDEWGRWGRYEGGRHLQDWWIHAKTAVEDLRIAKLAKVVHDTLSGTGKAELMVLEALPPAQQDELIRRVVARGTDGGHSPN